MPRTTTIHDRVLPRLEERFSGDVIRSSDARYGAARALWNAIVDRRPALIARPRTSADVAMAILSARDAELEIAVRSGGHSLPGHSMSEGGITIDLSAMNAVEVDPGAAIARVGGGALLNDVGEALAPHALTMPFGHVSHTGVGGLTLGGGIGWVMRRYGLAVDSLRSAEVVTAEGEVVRASEEENPDLFWALRGGGGNFGVVTEFELALHPVGPMITGGMLLFEWERAHEVLTAYREIMAAAPDELGGCASLQLGPPAPFVPAALVGKPVIGIIVAAFADEEAAQE